jgi:hypothetical protein
MTVVAASAGQDPGAIWQRVVEDDTTPLNQGDQVWQAQYYRATETGEQWTAQEHTSNVVVLTGSCDIQSKSGFLRLEGVKVAGPYVRALFDLLERQEMGFTVFHQRCACGEGAEQAGVGSVCARQSPAVRGTAAPARPAVAAVVMPRALAKPTYDDYRRAVERQLRAPDNQYRPGQAYYGLLADMRPGRDHAPP